MWFSVMVTGNRHARIFKDAEMVFDESNDGADRCSDFISELIKLMKEHRVKVEGQWGDLQKTKLTHEDAAAENGWTIDMQDIQSLTDGKSR